MAKASHRGHANVSDQRDSCELDHTNAPVTASAFGVPWAPMNTTLLPGLSGFGALDLSVLGRLRLRSSARLCPRALVAAVIVACLGWLGEPGTARAASVDYQLESVTVQLNESGVGLQLFADTSALDTRAFSLDDGESMLLRAFTVGTRELTVGLTDLLPRSISATFRFALPGNAMSQVFGKSFGVLSFRDGLGVVIWDDPVLVSTDTAVFKTSLTNAVFGTPGQDLVKLKISQVSSNPIPEPASIALFLAGAAILALLMLGRDRGQRVQVTT